MTAEERLCRWAEKKWNLKKVYEVTFEPGAHGPLSDVTPDLEPYLEVSVRVRNDRERHYADQWKYYEVQYVTDLIREIMEFSNEQERIH